MMQLLPVFCLQMAVILCAPLQLPLMQLQPSQQLQQQLLALQQLQMLKTINAANSPVALNGISPVLLLVPNSQINSVQNINHNIKNPNDINVKNDFKNTKIEENEDSVIINAETGDNIAEITPERRVFLAPNGKLSIGSVISAIPFLPIEINVPDSIAWIYNGISGIISGIGQRFPFRRPQAPANDDLRLLWRHQNLDRQNVLPILVVPVEVDAPIVSK